jgi:hypothetical protein
MIEMGPTKVTIKEIGPYKFFVSEKKLKLLRAYESLIPALNFPI